MSDNRTNDLFPCPFCGGEAEMLTAESMHGGDLFGIMCQSCCSRGDVYDTEAEAIAAWNARAKLGSDEPPYDELLRYLESDWHISASWDGLRRFWNIELTEEGVRLRDAELGRGTCRNVCKEWEKTNFANAATSFCCSECGAHYVDCECYYAGLADANEEQIRTNYCPNCGAKVRGA